MKVWFYYIVCICIFTFINLHIYVYVCTYICIYTYKYILYVHMYICHFICTVLSCCTTLAFQWSLCVLIICQLDLRRGTRSGWDPLSQPERLFYPSNLHSQEWNHCWDWNSSSFIQWPKNGESWTQSTKQLQTPVQAEIPNM